MNQLALATTPQPPLARQIPSWVLRRLQNAISSGVHYEASLYGPYNTLLTALFPMERQFMIKPQGLLRKEFDGGIASDRGSIAWDDLRDSMANHSGSGISDWITSVPTGEGDDGSDSDETEETHSDGTDEVLADTAALALRVDDVPDLVDTSLDSTGTVVDGVRKRGNSGNPDFVVVKATETLVDDTIIAIIEVKANDDADTFQQAMAQIIDYLNFVVSKRRDPNLKAYVFMAGTVHVWGFEGPASDAAWNELTSYPMDLNRLKRELYDIAGLHWQI